MNDDELYQLDSLLRADDAEETSLTWGERIREWVLVALLAVTFTVIIGLAAVGAVTMWFWYALS